MSSTACMKQEFGTLIGRPLCALGGGSVLGNDPLGASYWSTSPLPADCGVGLNYCEGSTKDPGDGADFLMSNCVSVPQTGCEYLGAGPCVTQNSVDGGNVTSIMDSQVRTHVQQIASHRLMRDRSDRLRTAFLQEGKTGPDYQELLDCIEAFKIPGGGWIDKSKPRSCDVYTARTSQLLEEYRKLGTWRKYRRKWEKGKAKLKQMLEEDVGVDPQYSSFWGFNARTLKTMESQQYVAAVVSWEYESNYTATGCDVMAAAINFAFRINDIPVEENFKIKVVKQAAKRLRTKANVKKAGVAFHEVDLINSGPGKTADGGWGGHAQAGKRMISLSVCLSFCALLRFSDLAAICVGGIYFYPGDIVNGVRNLGGCMICIPVRKNSQIEPSWVAVADTGNPFGVMARLRDMLKHLGYKVPLRGFIDSDYFLFRDVTLKDGHNHRHKRTDIISGDGVHSLTRKGYRHYLSRFRLALEECCNIPKEMANRDFGFHSMRSGGNTHLFNLGVSKQMRKDIGQWATDIVENGYLRIMMQDKLDTVRLAGL